MDSIKICILDNLCCRGKDKAMESIKIYTKSVWDISTILNIFRVDLPAYALTDIL